MQLNSTQLASAAKQLQIPVPNAETLNAILQAEGMMLVRNVEEAVRGNANAKAYLRGVLLSTHESTVDRIQNSGMSIPSLQLNVLLEIGKKEGDAFALRVKEWANAGYPDGETARYVRLTIARHLESVSQTAQRQEQQTQQRTGAGDVNPMAYRPNRPIPGASQRQEPQGGASTRSSDHIPGFDDAPEPPPWEGQNQFDSGRSAAQSPPALPSSQQGRGDFGDRNDRGGNQASRSADHGDGGQRRRESAESAPQRQGGDEQDVPQRQGESYLSEHIYGGKAAVCFSADRSRSERHTVRIEAAEAQGQRQYDWKGKIAIQLSQREMVMVLGVLMGWMPSYEGKGHGQNNEKWFKIDNQGNKLYISVNAKGRSPRGVPLMAGDTYSVTTLLMRQMLRNDDFLNAQILLSLVKKEVELACASPSQGAGHSEYGSRRAA